MVSYNTTLSPGGLAGATAATRYVGGTTSGAPQSGTFNAGDFVVDQSGALWVCVTAGTPGTWVEAGNPAATWLPADDGLLTANYDPITANSTQQVAAGTIYLTRFIIRQALTVTKLWFGINISAAGTSTGTFVGLYSNAGTLLSGSADCAGATGFGTSNDSVGISLTTPQAVAAGATVWAAFVVNVGTTLPTLYRNLGDAGFISFVPPRAASGYRFCVNGTGQTSLPGSLTLANNSATNARSFWVGIS